MVARIPILTKNFASKLQFKSKLHYCVCVNNAQFVQNKFEGLWVKVGSACEGALPPIPNISSIHPLTNLQTWFCTYEALLTHSCNFDFNCNFEAKFWGSIGILADNFQNCFWIRNMPSKYPIYFQKNVARVDWNL